MITKSISKKNAKHCAEAKAFVVMQAIFQI